MQWECGEEERESAQLLLLLLLTVLPRRRSLAVAVPPVLPTVAALRTSRTSQGMPPVEDLDRISPFASSMISSLSSNPGTYSDRDDDASVLGRFRALITSASDDALQLTRELLAFDPWVRLNVAGALASSYLAQFHNEAAERSASFKVSLPRAIVAHTLST